jgi:hypothetical protein
VRYDPRAILLALVSVLVADGDTTRGRPPSWTASSPREHGPLRPEEWVVHRPVEVAARIPPARRAEVVELMTQLACVDGEADPSELRVIESYAAAWAIPREDIEAWVERYRGTSTPPTCSASCASCGRSFCAPSPVDAHE